LVLLLLGKTNSRTTGDCGCELAERTSDWDGELVDDLSVVTFVVVAYVSLVVLFRCLHLLEMEERRRRTKTSA
jgi:hypothetical protein